ncbi:TcdA/TcdB catalytic glycosyltransferase domain-containing protein [Legionella sp. CNM-4043-24]|uniref:TcdA/TcdB catalytic glycosyltransferase domain-containing protein n=1 Tax=Legionella sp. CNM-4043-24 TaxID=3421646 RepID=UPI00403A9393
MAAGETDVHKCIDEIKIPNQIHIIWFGSFLRKSHQDRIILWKLKNPLHTVNLWICKSMLNEDTCEKFDRFCSENKISLHDVSKLNFLMEPSVSESLYRLMTHSQPNYAAISDIYRFYALKFLGGWYFDTDIDPKLALPVDLSLKYGFAIHAKILLSTVISFTPAIIVSSKESLFLTASLSIINNMTLASSDQPIPFIDHFSSLIHSRDAVQRMISTQITTGSIGQAACSYLCVDNNPLFPAPGSMSTEKTNVLSKKILLGSLRLDNTFVQNEENSWLLNEESELNEGLQNLAALKQCIFTRDRSAYTHFFDDLLLHRNKIFSEILPINLSETPEKKSDYSKSHSVFFQLDVTEEKRSASPFDSGVDITL